MRLGIVGQGYVGSAVREVFSKHYEVDTFDFSSMPNDSITTEIETTLAMPVIEKAERDASGGIAGVKLAILEGEKITIRGHSMLPHLRH